LAHGRLEQTLGSINRAKKFVKFSQVMRPFKFVGKIPNCGGYGAIVPQPCSNEVEIWQRQKMG